VPRKKAVYGAQLRTVSCDGFNCRGQRGIRHEVVVHDEGSESDGLLSMNSSWWERAKMLEGREFGTSGVQCYQDVRLPSICPRFAYLELRTLAAAFIFYDWKLISKLLSAT